MIVVAILAALLCSKQKEEKEKVVPTASTSSFTSAVVEELGEVAARAAQGPPCRQLTRMLKGVRGFILKDPARVSKVALRTKLLLSRQIV
jgi:hypothetical protein